VPMDDGSQSATAGREDHDESSNASVPAALVAATSRRKTPGAGRRPGRPADADTIRASARATSARPR
jgi:hypothetical protein